VFAEARLANSGWNRAFFKSLIGFALIVLAPVAASAAQMTFQTVKLGNGSCGDACSVVVVANGGIEASTPSDFAAEVASLGGAGNQLTVYMSSPGGNVEAAMQLGEMFRNLHVKAVITRLDPSKPGSRRGGYCVSACVYAMMGAVRRIAPPDAKIGLHRMSVESIGFAGISHHTVGPDLVSKVTEYAERMGVSGALVASAESQVPELVHLLSYSEMSNWRFATAQSF
jgi:hypothetical protein